jgi:hypothetical protein
LENFGVLEKKSYFADSKSLVMQRANLKILKKQRNEKMCYLLALNADLG